VCGDESGDDGHRDFDGLADGQPTRRDAGAQRAAFQQLGDEKGAAFRC
jgi:hypothetical protein